MPKPEQDKAMQLLKQILDTSEGKHAASQLEHMNIAQIRDKLSALDKQEIEKKLNAMNMGSLAQKLSGTSTKDLADMLKNNPQILQKLNNFLK